MLGSPRLVCKVILIWPLDPQTKAGSSADEDISYDFGCRTHLRRLLTGDDRESVLQPSEHLPGTRIPKDIGVTMTQHD
jgi:hypothetical protein